MMGSRRIILFLAAAVCVAADLAVSTCTTRLKPSPKPQLHCGQLGSLKSPALLNEYTAATFEDCRDSCRPYPFAEYQCYSFAFDGSSGSCKLLGSNLASQGFRQKNSDGYAYYSIQCFAYRVPLDAGFDDGTYNDWSTRAGAVTPDTANYSIIAPGYDGSAYAALMQIDGHSQYAASVEIRKDFGPLCPGESRALTFAYKVDSASYGVSSLGVYLVTAHSTFLVFDRVNFNPVTTDSKGNPTGQWSVLSYPFTAPQKANELLYVTLSAVIQGNSAYLSLELDSFQTPLV